MNHPRFVVYVAPRPITCMTQNYMPPEEDLVLLRDLWAQNINPQINAHCAPSLADIQSTVSGYILVYSGAAKELIKVGEYEAHEGDRIRCILWYATPLRDEELDALMPLWKGVFGLEPPADVPKEFEYLITEGCTVGTPAMISDEIHHPKKKLIYD